MNNPKSDDYLRDLAGRILACCNGEEPGPNMGDADVLRDIADRSEPIHLDLEYSTGKIEELKREVAKLKKQLYHPAIKTLLRAPPELIQDLWCEIPVTMQKLVDIFQDEIDKRRVSVRVNKSNDNSV